MPKVVGRKRAGPFFREVPLISSSPTILYNHDGQMVPYCYNTSSYGEAVVFEPSHSVPSELSV